MSPDRMLPPTAAGPASDMEYTINTAASVKDALSLLESNGIQTLFVTDGEGRMRGTLTSGKAVD